MKFLEFVETETDKITFVNVATIKSYSVKYDGLEAVLTIKTVDGIEYISKNNANEYLNDILAN